MEEQREAQREGVYYAVDTVRPGGKKDTFFVLARNQREARETAEQNIEHDGRGERIIRIYR